MGNYGNILPLYDEFVDVKNHNFIQKEEINMDCLKKKESRSEFYWILTYGTIFDNVDRFSLCEVKTTSEFENLIRIVMSCYSFWRSMDVEIKPVIKIEAEVVDSL